MNKINYLSILIYFIEYIIIFIVGLFFILWFEQLYIPSSIVPLVFISTFMFHHGLEERNKKNKSE